jgi:transposase
MQTKSSTSWKEQRRLRAYEMKGQGWKQCDIASALGVTKGAVSQWIGNSDQEGEQVLQAKPHTGRPAELTVDQKRDIPDLLSQGAEAYGFRGDVWTCPRIGRVIEWEYGVVYHKSHVARLLQELKWTPQMPLERAKQRDEVAIAAWRSESWKELKKRLYWNVEP